MASIRDLEWEACLLEPRRDRAMERRLRRETGGGDAGSLAYFTACPWAAEAMARLNVKLLTRVRVEHELADLVGLVVSQDSSCRYCFAIQRVLLRVLGYPQARIAQLEAEFRLSDLAPRERAALAFARRVSRANPLPATADVEALRAAGFDDLAIKELAGLSALMVFFNRVSTLPALPPETWEAFPDRWLVRAVRPILAWHARKQLRRAPLAPLRPQERSGPFAYLVCALDGLPLAAELRRTLDAMWASPVLGRRAKALAFAVVARALGCTRCEREAVGLLHAEGFREEEAAHVLAHLVSPRLDPVERAIVPFARETVWYQPADIQRRARALRAALSEAEFVELVMVVALANAVARLGFVADGAA